MILIVFCLVNLDFVEINYLPNNTDSETKPLNFKLFDIFTFLFSLEFTVCVYVGFCKFFFFSVRNQTIR